MSKFNIRKVTPTWESPALTVTDIWDDASDKPQAESRQDKLAMILAIMLLCLFEIHTLQLIQVGGFYKEMIGAQSILHGEAEYRAFQNRLLGPMLVALSARITGQPFAPTYALCTSGLIAASNFLCYYLVKKITGQPKVSLAATAGFGIAVVYIQDSSWFFLWDAVDLVTMLVFAYAVFYAKNDLRILIPLYAVELLNRESAEFIALWIVLSAAYSIYNNRWNVQFRRNAYWQGFVGVALLAAGTVWTHAIRKLLFRHSFDPKINLDLQHKGDGQWFTLVTNFTIRTWTMEPSSFAIAIICCLAIALILYRLYQLQGKAALPIAGLIGAMTLSNWLFARVVETRVWLDFVPFFIVYAFTIEKYESSPVKLDGSEPAPMRRAA